MKSVVFSSSATVYGDPATVPITEDFPLSATNPDIAMTLHAAPQENESNYADNQVSVYFADQLFVGEFEY